MCVCVCVRECVTGSMVGIVSQGITFSGHETTPSRLTKKSIYTSRRYIRVSIDYWLEVYGINIVKTNKFLHVVEK